MAPRTKKIPAPKKPAPLKFPGELIPAAAIQENGGALMNPRLYLNHRELEKLFNWSGRALNWLKHREALLVERAARKLKSKKR